MRRRSRTCKFRCSSRGQNLRRPCSLPPSRATINALNAMSSIGESDIVSASRHVGKLRVLSIYADSAIYPRLGISLGCTLFEVPESRSSPEGLPPVELRGISGELRLEEHGPIVGSVLWSDKPRRVRSSAHPYEHHLKLTCDLDHIRIERIENLRGDKSPGLALNLWPVLVRGGEDLDADARPIRLRIPREEWLEFLSRTRGNQYEILEIRYDPNEAASFQAALGHTRTARALIDNGDPRAAVGACRLALDAILDENPRVPKGSRPDQLKALWTLAEERAHSASVDQYKAVFSKVQALTSVTHHNYGSAVAFRRSEALFTVRMTECLLSLLGDLTAPE